MWFNKKKQYFNKKARAVQNMIWDLEFKRAKSLMIREGIRKVYDQTKAKLDFIFTKIKNQLRNPEKICEIHNPGAGKEKVHKDKGICLCEYTDNAIPIAEIENLYDQKELLLADTGRHEAQMREVDLKIHGSRKTNEYPEGEDGLDQQLEALRELQLVLKEYLKEL